MIQRQVTFISFTCTQGRKKNDFDMKRGECHLLSANGVTCVKWMDNRSVFSRTFCTTSNRKVCSGGKTKVQEAEIVISYHNFMGSCDRVNREILPANIF